ncbi:MAG: hypothetical protein AAGH90_01970 [Pseudomonadota bacterium]
MNRWEVSLSSSATGFETVLKIHVSASIWNMLIEMKNNRLIRGLIIVWSWPHQALGMCPPVPET